MSKIGSTIEKLRGNSLKVKAARGSLILTVGTFTERGIRLVRNMILARLLAPGDFGLMAIVMSASMAFEAFTDVGVKQSVIHDKKGDQEKYLNVAWWFQVLRGLGLFMIAYLMMPWISSFYGNAELLPLMKVAFTAILFNGFISPHVYVLEKRIQFGKWVFLYQGSGLLGTFISLIVAFFVVRNVWALVIGFTAEAVFRCVLSYILCPFMPKTNIDRESLNDILRYARRMLGVPILAVLAFQLDVLVLGKIVSSEMLGMYWLGIQLTLQIGMLFSKVIYPVLLPIFAEKQDDKLSICRAVKKITLWTGIFGIPITTFLVVCSNPLLTIVYGSRYATVAIPFGLLSIYVLLRTNGSILSQVYFAIGKPHLHRYFVAFRLIVLVCLIYPAVVWFGLIGSATVVLFANATGLCLQIVLMKKAIGLSIREYIVCWLPGLQAAMIVLVPMLLLQILSDGALVLNITAGALTCLSACAIGSWWQLQGKDNQFFSRSHE